MLLCCYDIVFSSSVIDTRIQNNWYSFIMIWLIERLDYNLQVLVTWMIKSLGRLKYKWRYFNILLWKRNFHYYFSLPPCSLIISKSIVSFFIRGTNCWYLTPAMSSSLLLAMVLLLSLCLSEKYITEIMKINKMIDEAREGVITTKRSC